MTNSLKFLKKISWEFSIFFLFLLFKTTLRKKDEQMMGKVNEREDR